MRMRLNLGIRRRLAPLMGGDKKKIELLYAILYSLPGTPIIYYGDEIGMGDNIWLPDRDGVRTPMQWTNEKNAGFSTVEADELYLPIIDNGPFSFEKINVEAQLDDKQSLLNHLKMLMLTRKSHPVFSSQSYRIDEQVEAGILSVRRENLHCLHNLTDEFKTIKLEEGEYSVLRSSMPDLVPGSEINEEIILEPYTYAWLIEAPR
jgi:maltose alpha-D-glucosyltransferase/alpha-amylase